MEQTGINACLLLTIGLCGGLTRRSPLRLAGTSLVIAALSAWMSNAMPLLRAMTLLACAVGGPLLAWPGVPKRLWMRLIASGCFLALGFTGLMRFMHGLALPSAVMVLLGCALLRSVAVIRPRVQELPRLAAVDVRHGAHHLTMTALIDSGNLLRDSVTGLPVVVVSRRAAERLVQLPQKGKLTYPFRLLSVRTISGTALMTVFHPDSVCIQTPEGWQRRETLLGVSPDGYDGFQALVPACLVQPGAAEPASGAEVSVSHYE